MPPNSRGGARRPGCEIRDGGDEEAPECVRHPVVFVPGWFFSL